MKNKLHTALTVILSMILVLSIGMLVYQQFSRRNAAVAAQQAVELAGIPSLPTLP